MKNRAEEIAAKFTIISKQGKGTQCLLTLNKKKIDKKKKIFIFK